MWQSQKLKGWCVQAYGVREWAKQNPGSGWSETEFRARENRVKGEPRTACLAGVVLLFAHARMSVPRVDKDKFHCG